VTVTDSTLVATLVVTFLIGLEAALVSGLLLVKESVTPSPFSSFRETLLCIVPVVPPEASGLVTMAKGAWVAVPGLVSI